MAANTEDTVFNESLAEQVKEIVKEAKARKKGGVVNKKWQRVAIGSASGVLLGVASSFVPRPANADDAETELEDGVITTENGLKVAEVDDSQSFKEAFDTAREKVGAGGAFNWHGNTYSTYSEKEWDSMSESEHDDYMEQVIEAKETNFAPAHDDGTVVSEDAGDVAIDDYTVVGDNVQHNVDDSSDVQIVGSSNVTLDDGSVVTVGEAVVNDHEVYLVDLDNDNVYDQAVDDINGDGVIQDAETYDVQSDNLVAESGVTEADNLIL